MLYKIMLEKAELAARQLNKFCPRRAWTEDNFWYYDGFVRLRRNCRKSIRETCPCHDQISGILFEINHPSLPIYIALGITLMFLATIVYLKISYYGY